MRISFFACILYLTGLSAAAQTNQWVAAGMPAYGHSVRTLYVDTANDLLYAGGNIEVFGNSSTEYSLTVYDGHSWDTLGRFSGPVFSILNFEGDLYVGGLFHLVNEKPIVGLAKYDGTTWTDPTGFDPGYVARIRVIDDTLYIAGVFDIINGDSIHSIAKYNGDHWLSVYDFPGQLGGATINDFIIYKGDFFVAGNFVINNTSDLLVYENSSWQPVGNGISGGFNEAVELEVYKDNLYVSGTIDKAAGNVGHGIQKWDGQFWTEVGSSLQRIEGQESGQITIRELEKYNSYLYASGTFLFAEDVPAPQGIALWNGQQWCALNDTSFSPGSTVNLAFFHDTLFAGGSRTTMGFNGLAKYDGKYLPDTCGELFPVGQQELLHHAQKDLMVYPNPTNDLVNLEWSGNDQSYAVKIFDVHGRLVVSEQHLSLRESHRHVIATKELTSGLYYISISGMHSDEAYSTKLLKH